MSARSEQILFDNVSKFYGEVLGVNRVHLTIDPGITGLVGPNGSGKSTLMNLMAGLLQPTRGSVEICGHTLNDPEGLFRIVGYATQIDSFPKGITGYQLIESYLRLHGHGAARAHALALRALERVNLLGAAERRVAGYSKGMRQRIKLAQAIAHDPKVLILDEPMNGLDPMARAEVIALFEDLAREGKHLLISSHILHEVDMISDRVILINGGYIVAEGNIQGVRSEVTSKALQVMIRCDQPQALASRLFQDDHIVEIKLHEDQGGLLARTRDPDRFHLLINDLVAHHGFTIESLGPADEDVQAVYEYLIGEGGTA